MHSGLKKIAESGKQKPSAEKIKGSHEFKIDNANTTIEGL